MTKNQLSYRVFFSDEDDEWVGICEPFGPRLSHLAATPEEALAGIRALVAEVIDDLRAEGKPMPWEVTAPAAVS